MTRPLLTVALLIAFVAGIRFSTGDVMPLAFAIGFAGVALYEKRITAWFRLTAGRLMRGRM